ncbi:MAG: hypothetical protein ACXVB0_24805 [Mucilaginibacter sp.]
MNVLAIVLGATMRELFSVLLGIAMFISAFHWGNNYGKSQCYPYAVSHSEAMKQGGNHE